MLSDEEKQAIEYWQYIRDTQIYDGYKGQAYAVTLLNLIEKQSKEIEELKDKNKKLQDKAKELIYEKQQLTSALLDSTPNDKIKARIEELEEYSYKGNIKDDFLMIRIKAKIQELHSLLEKE